MESAVSQHFIIQHYGLNELPERARRSLLLRILEHLSQKLGLTAYKPYTLVQEKFAGDWVLFEGL